MRAVEDTSSPRQDASDGSKPEKLAVSICFPVHSQYRTFDRELRLSYANSTENILRALDRMGEFLASRKAA